MIGGRSQNSFSTCIRYTIKSTRADDEISHEMFAEDTACVAAWCMPADHRAAGRTALSTPGSPSLFSFARGSCRMGNRVETRWTPVLGQLHAKNVTINNCCLVCNLAASAFSRRGPNGAWLAELELSVSECRFRGKNVNNYNRASSSTHNTGSPSPPPSQYH